MTTKFDDEFQQKILALVLRDQNFCERVDGLLTVDFFDKESSRYIYSVINKHYNKYKTNPSHLSLITTFKEDATNKLVRSEVVHDISEEMKELYKTDISDRDYIIDKVSDFVRRQATINAILKSSEIIDAGGDIGTILPIVQKAIDVGTSDLSAAYDFNENLEQRFEIRQERSSGKIEYNSVSTGFKRFDETLFRKGWGKKELSVYMAPAKSGKSVALLDHAIKACEKGYKVLFVSLEVSTEIQVDRMDANISGVKLDDIYTEFTKVRDRIEKWRDHVKGVLKIHEYASGTYRPSDLRRLIKKYQAIGVYFDFVVVDYADIMLADVKSDNSIDKSKSVFIDLRAIAQQENIAILTAIQTNRDGAKVELIEGIHAAEDFNKIRIADLVISINATAIEKEAGDARLYFAASRNQKAVTITVKRDLSCMKHIREIIAVR